MVKINKWNRNSMELPIDILFSFSFSFSLLFFFLNSFYRWKAKKKKWNTKMRTEYTCVCPTIIITRGNTNHGKQIFFCVWQQYTWLNERILFILLFVWFVAMGLFVKCHGQVQAKVNEWIKCVKVDSNSDWYFYWFHPLCVTHSDNHANLI